MAPRYSSKRAFVRVIRRSLRLSFLLFLASPPVWAISVSPSPSYNGSYTVSWDYSVQSGCVRHDLPPDGYNYYIACTYLEENVGGGWTGVSLANGVTSWGASGKAAGTYQYKLVSYVSYYSYPSNLINSYTVTDGPVSVEVCGSPSFSVSNASATEGGTLGFTVTRSGPTSCSYSLSYYTSSASTADDWSDFNAASGTLTFSAGQTTKPINVTTMNDSTYEIPETMILYLYGATGGATIADYEGIGTITDNDSPPSFTISNASGSEGGVFLVFTVTKSGATQVTHSISYATADGTAKIADDDYQDTSGTLTFGPTEVTKTFTVTPTEDSKYESDETFYANLSNATSGATIADGHAAGVITNNDPAPSFTIGNASVSEGGSLTFSVTKSGSTALSHSVHFATANGTATTADGDYTATSGTLTFAAGDTTKTITVPTTADSKYENNEALHVNLSSATNGATIADNQGVGTITNNDSPPSFTINDVSIGEGGNLSFVVAKTGQSAFSHNVTYATADGSAVAGSDYTSASGTLSFSSGEASKSVTISTAQDIYWEGNETVKVNLSGATNGATIADTQGIGTIIDDDDDEPSGLLTVAPNATGYAPGATAGSVDVNQLGSATYTIPIAIAPGTTGIKPHLALVYSSGSGDGIMGIGWSVRGLSSIARCQMTSAQDSMIDGVDYDSDDRFCLDGQRLVAINGMYGADGTQYRTEIDQFARIISYGDAGSGPAYFKVWTKTGRILEYGYTSDSRIEAQGRSEVRVWGIDKVSDNAGNYMRISYWEDPGHTDFQPELIEYTMNDGADVTTPYASVDFIYEPRPDVKLSSLYQGGSAITNSTNRLTHVKSYNFAPDGTQELVRDYVLAYDNNGLATNGSYGGSRLTSVTECSSASCLKPTLFTWEGAGTPPNLTANAVALPSTSGYTPAFGDWNGDGRTDVFLQANNNSTASHLYVAGSNGAPVATSFNPTGWSRVDGQDTNQAITGDFNGDGLTDLAFLKMQFVESIPHQTDNGVEYDLFYDALLTVYHSSLNGSGDLVMTPVQQSLVLAQHVVSAKITTGDWNGDGRTDFFTAPAANPVLYFSDANGQFGQPTATSALTPYATGDFDGDGRTDLLADGGVYLSNGGNLQFYGNSGLPGTNKWLVADFNGDGLDDVLSPVTTPVQLFLSRGDGTFVQVWSGNNIPFGDWPTFAVGDWNNDGRADFSYSDGGVREFLVSTGNTSTGFFASLTTISGWNDSSLSAADFNGDGLTDVWPEGDTYYTSTQSGFDVIKQITNGLGATTTFAYELLTSGVYTKGTSPGYPIVNIQNTDRVVATVSTDDGAGGQRVTSYEYAGGATDVSRLASVGFKTVTVTDERTGMRTITEVHQDFPYVGMPESVTRQYVEGQNAVTLEQTTYEDALINTSGTADFPYVHKKTTLNYELDDSFVSRAETTNVYDGFGNPTSVTEKLFNAPSGGAAQYTSVTTGDYQNVTSGSNWLLGELICQRTTNSAVGETTETRTSGFEYDAHGLVHKEAIEPQSGSIAEAGGISDCVTANASDLTLTLTTTYVYDDFGNRHTITVDDLDSQTPARATTIDYGELAQSTYGDTNPSNSIAAGNGRFPVKTTNAKGHIEYFEYDGRFGAVVRHDSANGQNAYQAYDDFGRPTAELRPDGTQTAIYYAPCTSETCGTGGTLKSVNFSDGEPTTAVITDFLGRTIMTVKEGFDGAPLIAATQYDDRGFVSRKSLPYLYGETPEWTDFDPASSPLDALGRVTHRMQPGAGSAVIDTTVAYSPLTIVTTDDKGHTSTQHFTLRGQLADTVDAAGTSTQYGYDAFGDLRKVEVDGNTATDIVNTYDLRGRKREMTDPDMGHWTYAYNGFGELAQQADAKGQVTNLDHDVLGRLIERDDPLEGTTSFIYDTAAHGLGFIAETDAAEGETKSFTYDALSRPRAVTTTIAGEPSSFVTDREYDPYGRVSKIIYPASPDYPLGFRVRYDYNAQGYLNEVHNDDASNALIWRLNDQTLDLTDVTLGNGVHATRSYLRETGDISRIRAASPSSPAGTYDVQDLYYEYDTLGNVTLRQDVNRNVLERSGSYVDNGVTKDSYDALNRLTHVERVLGTVSQDVKTYTYDPLGNLTNKTGLGNYDYATTPAGCPAGSVPSGPHAVKQIGTVPFCYDADGNQIQGYDFPAARSRTLTWTSYNKPKTITEAGQTITFSYGADRSRFKQVNGFTGQTTLYVDGLYEKQTLGTLVTHVHYIYADGEAVALYKSRSDGTHETEYLHRDHLGSVVEVTDENAQVAESFSYDPWGKRRNPADWSDPTGPIYANETQRGHTGHEQLDDVGLSHMNGRVYDPVLGRVLSADPYVQAPSASQSYNRYAYVGNNPLTYTDPSGYCTASGAACPAGGFVSGLGGVPGGISSPSLAGSFSFQQQIQLVAFQWVFPGLGHGLGGGLGGMCFMAAGCSASTILYDMDNGGFGNGGIGAPNLVMITGVFSYTYTYNAAYAYGPANSVAGQGWLAKLWGRFVESRSVMLEAESNPQGDTLPAAIASTGVLTYPAPTEIPIPRIPPWVAVPGRWAVSIGGKAIGVMGGIFFPSNGLRNEYKRGECYGTLTCAARPVYNENKGDDLKKLPTGSRGIDQTPWSGDHGAIKDALGLGGADNVYVDPDNNVWVQHPDGSFENEGPAGNFTGSGKASGRRGRDRDRR